MTERVVLIFNNDKHLYLIDVVRGTNGEVKQGHVVNGNWTYERDGNEILSKDWDRVVSRIPYSGFVREVIIPTNMNENYTDIINWAIKM